MQKVRPTILSLHLFMHIFLPPIVRFERLQFIGIAFYMELVSVSSLSREKQNLVEETGLLLG